MLNICTARTIIENPRGFKEAPGHTLKHEGLPHEPRSEHRFMLAVFIPPRGVGPLPMIGAYAECKHCSSIYSVDDAS